jgi:hypothetical protein
MLETREKRIMFNQKFPDELFECMIKILEDKSNQTDLDQSIEKSTDIIRKL